MTDRRRQRSLYTEHTFDETMSRMTDVITFRAPTGEAKATLEEYAAALGESVSTFIRTAIAQRVRRIDDEWVPTGNPAIDRNKIQSPPPATTPAVQPRTRVEPTHPRYSPKMR